MSEERKNEKSLQVTYVDDILERASNNKSKEMILERSFQVTFVDDKSDSRS